jgi:hypothetical protein
MNKKTLLTHNSSMEEVKNTAKTTTVKKAATKKATPTKIVKKSVSKTTPKAAPQKEQSNFSRFGDKVGGAFAATGRGIKHAFMEMSESLAGWIDDTSRELQKEMAKNKSEKASVKTTKKVTTKKTKK